MTATTMAQTASTAQAAQVGSTASKAWKASTTSKAQEALEARTDSTAQTNLADAGRRAVASRRAYAGRGADTGRRTLAHRGAVAGRRADTGRSRRRTNRDGWRASLRGRWRTLRRASEAGLATAEYAIATIAAAGFAGLLIVILKSSEVRGLLTGIIRSALSIG